MARVTCRSQSASQDPTGEHHGLIARAFDAEIEKTANNPTLPNLILSPSIVGQELRARVIELMATHMDFAEHGVQGRRGTLAPLRRRDPDIVEEVFRRHATARVELLLHADEPYADPASRCAGGRGRLTTTRTPPPGASETVILPW
jgi:hypothetical protein